MEIHSLKQGGEILSFTRTKQDFQVPFYRPAGLYFPIPCRPASQWSCTAHSPAVPPRSSLLPSQLCRSGWWLDLTNWKVFSNPSDSVNPASTQHWLTLSPIPPPPPPLLIALLYSPCSVQYSSFFFLFCHFLSEFHHRTENQASYVFQRGRSNRAHNHSEQQKVPLNSLLDVYGIYRC